MALAARTRFQLNEINVLWNEYKAAASAPRALKAVNAVFALDPDTKRRALPLVSRDGFVRGYLPVFGESGLKGAYREWKEGFSFGYPWEDEPDAKQQPANPL